LNPEVRQKSQNRKTYDFSIFVQCVWATEARAEFAEISSQLFTLTFYAEFGSRGPMG